MVSLGLWIGIRVRVRFGSTLFLDFQIPYT